MTAMQKSDMQYSRWRWILTVCALILHTADILTDTVLVVKYFQQASYVWSGLTALFNLTGLIVTQIFSYAWFLDSTQHEQVMDSRKKRLFLVLHVFGMGIFLRYYQLLKEGFKEVRKLKQKNNEKFKESHHKLFYMATDLSMLKLFETFLESAPQLLLQLYVRQSNDEWFVSQYLSLVFSFFNLAWSLVDYWRCLRISLPYVREMPSGFPTVVYLLYKIFTITSLTLSYSLLLVLSVYSTVGFTFIWLLGTIWAHLCKTAFCTSSVLELLYRGVIGAIMVFSFFNIRGQNTKIEMTVYYLVCTVINFSTPIMLFFLKPELQTMTYFWVVSGLIYGGSLLGLLFLVSYYSFLHPKMRQPDEVDGMMNETPSAKRIKTFIKP